MATRSAASTSAAYSARSSAVSTPSLARSASTSTLAWTAGSTLNSTTRRADSASRHRLSGSRKLSRTLETTALPIWVHYHRILSSWPSESQRRSRSASGSSILKASSLPFQDGENLLHSDDSGTLILLEREKSFSIVGHQEVGLAHAGHGQ